MRWQSEEIPVLFLEEKEKGGGGGEKPHPVVLEESSFANWENLQKPDRRKKRLVQNWHPTSLSRERDHGETEDDV